MDKRDCRLRVPTLLMGEGYDITSLLAKGYFSTVFAGHDLNKKYNLAFKVVTEAKTDEISIWPYLMHPNVLPLLRTLTFDDKFTVFVTSRQEMTLFQQLKADMFLRDPSAFESIRRWIYHCLCALAYLHDRGISHLDIKADNVLISKYGNAILTDFTFVTERKCIKSVMSVGLPGRWRPPEVCLVEDKGIVYYSFLSEKLDLWSYGILCFEMMTNFALLDYVRIHAQNRKIHSMYHVVVRPFLKGVLRDIRSLMDFIQSSYPAVRVTRKDIFNCLNFLQQFLTEKPTNRLSAREAIKNDLIQYRRSQARRSSAYDHNVGRIKARKIKSEPSQRVTVTEDLQSTLPRVGEDTLERSVSQEPIASWKLSKNPYFRMEHLMVHYSDIEKRRKEQKKRCSMLRRAISVLCCGGCSSDNIAKRPTRRY